MTAAVSNGVNSAAHHFALFPYATARFRVDVHDQAEYQRDQPKQRAEHDDSPHRHAPSTPRLDIIVSTIALQ